MITIFLPAYNEERDIAALLLRIREEMEGLRAFGARVAEVPLVLRYDLKTGQSKMKVVRTIMRYLVLITRNLFLPQRNLL